MALLAGMTLFAACSDDETNNNGDNGIADGTTLSGAITEDVTLKAGNTYKLSGAYTVEEGATLNIEQGVKIVSVYDDNVDYILIKQGGKINAKGTANAPIVMTSEKEEAGAWGGIHICGRAHTNAEGGKGSSEIGGAEPCNTYAWNIPAMLSMKNTKPTASASMAWATVRRSITV